MAQLTDSERKFVYEIIDRIESHLLRMTVFVADHNKTLAKRLGTEKLVEENGKEVSNVAVFDLVAMSALIHALRRVIGIQDHYLTEEQIAAYYRFGEKQQRPEVSKTEGETCIQESTVID